MKTVPKNQPQPRPRTALMLGVLVVVALLFWAVASTGGSDPEADAGSTLPMDTAAAPRSGLADPNATCDVLRGAALNPFGGSVSPNCKDLLATAGGAAEAQGLGLELEKAAQQALDQAAQSSNKIWQTAKLLDEVFDCSKGLSPAQAQRCIPILSAQQSLANDLVSSASTGDASAKFELARLLFKEQTTVSSLSPQILSSLESKLSKNGEGWHARALQLLKEAASQGHASAADQLARIEKGEGFLLESR